MATKTYFCTIKNGIGSFRKKIDSRRMFVITEIRISAHATYTKRNRWRAGKIKFYVKHNNPIPITSSPTCKFKTINIVVNNKTKCIRYRPDIPICANQYLLIKGIKLKRIVYTITVFGYRITN